MAKASILTAKQPQAHILSPNLPHHKKNGEKKTLMDPKQESKQITTNVTQETQFLTHETWKDLEAVVQRRAELTQESYFPFSSI